MDNEDFQDQIDLPESPCCQKPARDRAFRRFMRAVKIAKRVDCRKKLFRFRYRYGDLDQRTMGIMNKTGTLCSCTACGNARKHFAGKRSVELTKQERIAERKTKEFLKELVIEPV